MKTYDKNTIDTLADIFLSWQSQTNTSDNFFQSSGLSKIISSADLQNLMEGRSCFAPEAIPAIYGLLPIKLKLKDISLNIFPQNFYRLNLRAFKQANISVINISFRKIEEIYKIHYLPKQKFIKENKDKLRYENQKAKNPQQIKAAYQRYRATLTSEEKSIRNEKNKLRMRQHRTTHPESIKLSNQKAKEKYIQLSEIEKLSKKIAERIRNKKYRETHKEEINKKNKKYRDNLDLERAKQRAHSYNLSESHKKSAKSYYEAHKQEILAKAKDNPQSKIYKQRYKIKKRFQEKTGPQILALLQAITTFKSK